MPHISVSGESVEHARRQIFSAQASCKYPPRAFKTPCEAGVCFNIFTFFPLAAGEGRRGSVRGRWACLHKPCIQDINVLRPDAES